MKYLQFLIPILLLWCGCSGKPAGSALSRAESVLEPDGVVYILRDGAYDAEVMQGIQELAGFAIGLAQATGEMGRAEGALIRFQSDLPSILGLQQCLASGRSTVRLPKGGFRTRWVAVVPEQAKGVLWNMHGKPFDLRQEIHRLPAGTLAMGRFTLSAPSLWKYVKSLPAYYGMEENPFVELEEEAAHENFPFAALLQGLQEGVTLALLALAPSSSPHFQMPEALPGGFVAGIGDPNGVLLSALYTVSKEENAPFTAAAVEGITVYSIRPPSGPMALSGIHYAGIEGRLWVSNSSAAIAELVHRRGGKKDHPLSQKVGESLPADVRQAWVVDPALPAALTRLSSSGLGRMSFAPVPGKLLSGMAVSGVVEQKQGVHQLILLHSGALP